MVKCCGKQRTSRFCPDCGKEIGCGLSGLLAHCETMATQSEERVKTREKNGWTEEQLKEKRTTATKWRTWATELKELMERK